MRYVSYQTYDMNTIKANNPTNIIARNIGDIPDTGMPIALVGGVHWWLSLCLHHSASKVSD